MHEFNLDTTCDRASRPWVTALDIQREATFSLTFQA